MHKSLLIILGIVFLTFSASAQEAAASNANEVVNCDCNEVIMIANGIEKKYAGAWLSSVDYREGLLVFQKGTTVHKWNPERIVMIEKTPNWVRVYMK